MATSTPAASSPKAAETGTTTKLPRFTYPRTNLGALTTTFTPPESCFVIQYLGTGHYDITSIGSTMTFIYGYPCHGMYPADDCFPNGYASAWGTLQPETKTFPILSPGLYCPSGFTSACEYAYSDLEAPASGFLDEFQATVSAILETTEKAVGCCPRCVCQILLKMLAELAKHGVTASQQL